MQFHIAHFSAFSRRIFHPRPQEGVFRCDFNKGVLTIERGNGVKSLILIMDKVPQGKGSLCVRQGNQPKVKDKDLTREALTARCIGERHVMPRPGD
jgi:hypothetical protein